MSIQIYDGTEFQEVSDLHIVPSSTSFKKVQRVWMHDGEQYIMIKGRTFQVEWEKDLSSWGGTSWTNSNRLPSNNILLEMVVLSNGDLLGVVDYVINNNYTNQYSTNRYALIKLSASNGDISAFSTEFFMYSILVVIISLNMKIQPGILMVLQNIQVITLIMELRPAMRTLENVSIIHIMIRIKMTQTALVI